MYDNIRLYSKNLSILVSFFLLISLELFIINYYGDINILNSSENAITAVFFNKIASTPTALLPLLFFITVQLFIHFLFISCVYKYYEKTLFFCKENFVYKLAESSKFKLFLIYLVTIAFSYLLILIINNHYYPNSIFAFKSFFSNKVLLSVLNHKILFLFAVVYITITFIIGLINLIRPYIKYNFFILLLLISIFILTIYDKINISYNKNFDNTNEKPNIVLITIDSLRFDYINKINKTNDYNISDFIKNSVSFNNAYTPLARSFPALYSILSGKYPTEENIRFNLVNQQDIQFSQLLPHILKSNNYQTLYATDSNQFHIINEQWGYDKLVTPKQGIYEQLLPKLNDIPLSNLIINSSVSKYLFPYTYSNQSAGRLYDPITYVNNIKSSINRLDKNKSIFLHLNFEAAHWPYQNRYLDNNLPFQDRYLYCVNTLNWQISNIFKLLENYNLLNNTIVVLASDHGEALAIKNDKVINNKNYIGKKDLLKLVNKHPVNYTFDEIKDKNILDMILDINSSGGHGVDVLSKSQYQTIIALQKFENNKSIYPKKIINNNVILNDLYSTILELANIKSFNMSDSNQSISLAPLIDPSIYTKKFSDKILYEKFNNSLSNRLIFLETGLQVPYFDIKELNDQNILNKFINVWSKYYTINNKNYLELTREAVDKLVQTKQYAVIKDKDMLAYIPSGIKQQWRVEEMTIPSKLSSNTINNIDSCDIPRPIQDSDGQFLALLCGYYKESPGYYVYYNSSLDKWTLYKNANDFAGIQLVSKLNSNLIEHYKSEVPGQIVIPSEGRAMSLNG